MSVIRREDGITLVELMVASALSLVVLGGILTALVVADRTQVFGSRQSRAVDDATLAMQQLDIHVRSALALGIVHETSLGCDRADGNCLEITARTASGSDEQYRYRLDGTTLLRERRNTATNTYEQDRVLAEQVVNLSQTGAPVFDCTATGQLLTVTLDIRPNANSEETYRQRTSLRPRNGVVSNCT